MTAAQEGDVVLVRSGTLLGGPPGDAEPPCLPGNPGPPFVVETGTLTQTPWPARHFAVTTPVRTDELVGVELSGQRGDLAWLAFSTSTAVQPIGSVVAPLAVGAPLAVPGPLATGQLAFSVTTFVPPGAEALVWYVQALFVDGLGAATLSDPAHVTELDASL